MSIKVCVCFSEKLGWGERQEKEKTRNMGHKSSTMEKQRGYPYSESSLAHKLIQLKTICLVGAIRLGMVNKD